MKNLEMGVCTRHEIYRTDSGKYLLCGSLENLQHTGQATLTSILNMTTVWAITDQRIFICSPLFQDKFIWVAKTEKVIDKLL